LTHFLVNNDKTSQLNIIGWIHSKSVTRHFVSAVGVVWLAVLCSFFGSRMDTFSFASESLQILTILSQKYPYLSTPSSPPASPHATSTSPHDINSAPNPQSSSSWQDETIEIIYELIKNSENALLSANYKNNSSLKLPLPLPLPLRIQIQQDRLHHCIIVQDSGIGMSKSDLISFLGVIGRSGTKIFRDNIPESAIHNLPFVGSLDGISFYFLFLISEKVQVYSRHEESVHLWEWTDVSPQNFTIDTIPPPAADPTPSRSPLATVFALGANAPNGIATDDSVAPTVPPAAAPAVLRSDYLTQGTKVIIHLKRDRHSLLDGDNFENRIRQKCGECPVSHEIHFDTPPVPSSSPPPLPHHPFLTSSSSGSMHGRLIKLLQYLSLHLSPIPTLT
jgi:hypothetical protein